LALWEGELGLNKKEGPIILSCGSIDGYWIDTAPIIMYPLEKFMEFYCHIGNLLLPRPVIIDLFR